MVAKLAACKCFRTSGVAPLRFPQVSLREVPIDGFLFSTPTWQLFENYELIFCVRLMFLTVYK